MGDMASDMARSLREDTEMERLRTRYRETLVDFVESGTKRCHEAACEAFKALDARVFRHEIGALRDEASERVRAYSRRIRKLRRGNREAWAETLGELLADTKDPCYKAMKRLSPFRDDAIVALVHEDGSSGRMIGEVAGYRKAVRASAAWTHEIPEAPTPNRKWLSGFGGFELQAESPRRKSYTFMAVRKAA